MTENIEHRWVKDIFTRDELKQYVEFEEGIKANKTPKQKADFKNQWQQLLNELKDNLKNAPNSKAGIQLGKKYMDWVNGIYGKKYAHLRTKKWEQGFAEGKGLDDVGLTPELIAWLKKAMDAYFKDRIYKVLNKVGTVPPANVLMLWNEILDEMYGAEETRKISIYEMMLKDNKASQKAKAWLKNQLNLKQN